MINPLQYFYHNILPIQLKNRVEYLRYPEMNKKNAYLPIFERSKSIFIHIPKTAGTSVSEALYGEQPWHHPIKLYHELDAKKCHDYFSFAFVRNPWDRLYSTYNYAKKISHPIYRGPLSDIASYQTFEQFVMEWCCQQNFAEHHFLQPQFNYLTIDGDSIAVDFVGRFENIDDDFLHIARHMQLQTSLPKKNVGQHSSNRNVYTPEMVDVVEQVYAADVAKFGYQFER